jgi:hypothetical protein
MKAGHRFSPACHRAPGILPGDARECFLRLVVLERVQERHRMIERAGDRRSARRLEVHGPELRRMFSRRVLGGEGKNEAEDERGGVRHAAWYTGKQPGP